MQFYTIGYGGRKPGELVQLLKNNGIVLVVDVRLTPHRSNMGYYVKAKTPEKGIEGLFNRNGIEYLSLTELGNPYKDEKDEAKWKPLYRQYVEEKGESLFERLYQIEKRPFALLCIEKKLEKCHRQQITEYLIAQKGWTVEHIE